MSSLYLIPADNAKLMFRIYQFTLYVMTGAVVGLLVADAGSFGVVLGFIVGFIMSYRIRRLEEKARTHESNH